MIKHLQPVRWCIDNKASCLYENYMVLEDEHSLDLQLNSEYNQFIRMYGDDKGNEPFLVNKNKILTIIKL